MVIFIAVTTLTDIRFTSQLAKNIEEEWKFYAVRIISFLCENFIQIGYFSKSYARKQK